MLWWRKPSLLWLPMGCRPQVPLDVGFCASQAGTGKKCPLALGTRTELFVDGCIGEDASEVHHGQSDVPDAHMLDMAAVEHVVSSLRPLYLHQCKI